MDEHGILGGPLSITYGKSLQTLKLNLADQNGSDFPSACRRLLTEVLYTADLIDRDGHRIGRHPVKVIDLGIGCGDQTVTLLKDYPSLFESYIGITIDSTQFDFAQHRLSSLSSPEHFAYGTPNTKPYQPTEQEDRSVREEELAIDETTMLQKKLEEYVRDVNGKKPKTVKIFCTDAAQPSKWSAELNEAIRPKLTQGSTKPPLSKLSKQVTWVLALDTLYHFSPSRRPILDHCCQRLQASIMAFDLLLVDQATIFQQLCMCVLAILMGCPVRNFMTIDEYQSQLLKAGYEEDNIEIRDVSEHIFAGLANDIAKRDAELKMYLGKGIGAYKAFGWILKWWAWSGVIRGCIVVAKI